MTVNKTHFTAPGPVLVHGATNDDGPRISELVSQMGFAVEGLNWSNVRPSWLVAEIEGEIVGCVQALIGRPVGRLEFLSTSPKASPGEKFQIVLALIAHGLAMLQGGLGALLTGVGDVTRKP